jgi:hypothetical protein
LNEKEQELNSKNVCLRNLELINLNGSDFLNNFHDFQKKINYFANKNNSNDIYLNLERDNVKLITNTQRKPNQFLANINSDNSQERNRNMRKYLFKRKRDAYQNNIILENKTKIKQKNHKSGHRNRIKKLRKHISDFPNEKVFNKQEIQSLIAKYLE